MGLESAGRRMALIGRRVLPTFGVWTCIAVILKTFLSSGAPGSGAVFTDCSIFR